VKTTRSRIGLIAVGIMLPVVGVILRFATSVHSSGFNVHKVGDALLLVGVIVIVVVAMSSRRRDWAIVRPTMHPRVQRGD
jgi:uncharacterized membrane protein YidH (DUF202 family)